MVREMNHLMNMTLRRIVHIMSVGIMVYSLVCIIQPTWLTRPMLIVGIIPIVYAYVAYNLYLEKYYDKRHLYEETELEVYYYELVVLSKRVEYSVIASMFNFLILFPLFMIFFGRR